LNQASNGVKVVDTTADTTASKIKVGNSQLAALADEAEKAGGFQQAFGPLGDILDIGDGERITQEQENKVSPGTHILR
jgi:hypothetical protein